MEAAVDVALLGRYYERIADHAASMGRRIIYVVTGQLPETLAAAAVAVGTLKRTFPTKPAKTIRHRQSEADVSHQTSQNHQTQAP